MERKRHRTKHPGVYYRARPDGSRQYLIWFEGTDGRGHFQNVAGGEKEAKQARAKVVDRIAHGQKVAPSRVLFADFARVWLEEQVGLQPKSIETYRIAIEKHLILRLGPKTKLSDVDVNRVAQLVVSMQKDGKKAWTIRGALTPLSRIMATAVRRGMVGANPVPQLERFEKPKGDAAKINILDTDEIRLLLNSTTETYQTLLATAIFTGLRISELLALKWEDVDWEEGVLRVGKSKTRSGIREVVLMPALQQRLAAHSLEKDSLYVFETHDGRPMQRGTVHRWGLKAALKKAGITKHIRFHDLRHTFASILIAQGHDLLYIAEQMGHANPSTTLGTYGHLIDKKKKRNEARNKLEAEYGVVLP